MLHLMLTLILFVVLGPLWTLELKSHIKSCNKTVTRELWTTLGDSRFFFHTCPFSGVTDHKRQPVSDDISVQEIVCGSGLSRICKTQDDDDFHVAAFRYQTLYKQPGRLKTCDYAKDWSI